ncbi:4-hydroxy-3-methylbut-2-enyl diphosphate reductase [Thalictrum thalictroides]|uniref:4-hydroxy-3-methylbut-2-enyl diphosphate reductase n=1 Tax=Thalictrum thalictroides TaxID=46969 RepID=A0A7J6V5M6_THATH|nr:4-hydroxy-3-methylbut-2-enyl diphosphate reductase [Thalictrum thalictroides]
MQRLEEMDIKEIPNGDGKKYFDVVSKGDVVILPAFGAAVDEIYWVWNTVEKHNKGEYTSIIHAKYSHEETIATATFPGKYHYEKHGRELDGAFRGTDIEAVEMSRFLLKNEGLFVGISSAMNCVGPVRVAQSLGPGHTIVTILCESGMRHLSKFYDSQYLSQLKLTPSAKSD